VSVVPANSQQLLTDPTRTSADNCLCLAGYSLAAGLCTLCPEGSFNPNPGQTCAQCSVGHYYPESSAPFTTDLCVLCPLDSGSFAGSYGNGACICVPGFMCVGEECRQCTARYYCENQHSEILCPIFSTSTAGSSQKSDCKCMAGYFLNTNPWRARSAM